MSGRNFGPRLGRGLAALIGDPLPAAPEQPSSGPQSVPVEFLAPGPFQPRAAIAPASLTELIESVRTRGILQPLLVRPDPEASGRFQIIAGERRWRAAQAAGLHDVPALVRDLSDAEAMAAALVENLQRLDLNAIEEAEGYHRLHDEFGMSQERLGEAVGKSRSHVETSCEIKDFLLIDLDTSLHNYKYRQLDSISYQNCVFCSYIVMIIF